MPALLGEAARLSVTVLVGVCAPTEDSAAEKKTADCCWSGAAVVRQKEASPVAATVAAEEAATALTVVSASASAAAQGAVSADSRSWHPVYPEVDDTGSAISDAECAGVAVIGAVKHGLPFARAALLTLRRQT